jgi:transposase
MEVLYPRCAGLDVHARSVTACVRIASGPDVTYQHRTVPTTTRGLLELADWLAAAQCTHVGWKPRACASRCGILEGQVTLILANAMHVRHVPGRKSDLTDAAWIADLLAHGLIRSSFVPPAQIQALRDLTRTRKQLVGEIARHTLRIQKTLEDANVKLTHVVSDTLGTSGRAILKAVIAGETDPERLADLTQGRLKASRAQLVDALHGHVTAHHRFLLDLHLGQIERLDAAIAKLERHMGEAMALQRGVTAATMPGLITPPRVYDRESATTCPGGKSRFPE